MSILDDIVEEKRREIAKLPARSVSAADLMEVVESRGERHDFEAALRKPKTAGMGLIAEIKKASPSAGVICEDFDPVKTAKTYEAAGADCLSVLTDEKFFQGSLNNLRAVRRAVKLPLLRKDFIIDERQILEAVQAGADAILLIVAILSYRQLRHFHELALDAGIAALVEVHDEQELEQALMIGGRLIGVNNRDLKTFTVDLATTENLAAKTRAARDGREKLLVAESGIKTRADVERLSKCSAQAILIGETLMKESDVSGKIAELLGRK